MYRQITFFSNATYRSKYLIDSNLVSFFFPNRKVLLQCEITAQIVKIMSPVTFQTLEKIGPSGVAASQGAPPRFHAGLASGLGPPSGDFRRGLSSGLAPPSSDFRDSSSDRRSRDFSAFCLSMTLEERFRTSSIPPISLEGEGVERPQNTRKTRARQRELIEDPQT